MKSPIWNTLPTWTACLRYLGGFHPYLPFSKTLIKHSLHRLHVRLSSFPSLGFFRAIASATITSPISYGLLWGHFPNPRKIPALGFSDSMAWITANGLPRALSKNTRRELILQSKRTQPLLSTPIFQNTRDREKYQLVFGDQQCVRWDVNFVNFTCLVWEFLWRQCATGEEKKRFFLHVFP